MDRLKKLFPVSLQGSTLIKRPTNIVVDLSLSMKRQLIYKEEILFAILAC